MRLMSYRHSASCARSSVVSAATIHQTLRPTNAPTTAVATAANGSISASKTSIQISAFRIFNAHRYATKFNTSDTDKMSWPGKVVKSRSVFTGSIKA